MNDDIDIEEHDLLNNPTLRKIFPDIVTIKEEIPEFCEDSNVKCEAEDASITNWKTNISDKNDEIHNVIGDIGSDKDDVIFVEKRVPPLYGNKIILGSKPPLIDCKIEVVSEEIIEKIYSSNINLIDIGKHLEKSKKFCKSCLIYFPTTDSYNEHYEKSHSNINKPSPLPSHNIIPAALPHSKELNNETKRDSRNHIEKQIIYRTRTKRQLRNRSEILGPKIGKKNICFHCKKTFPSDKQLIDHMYMILKTSQTPNKLMENTIKHIQKRNLRDRRAEMVSNKYSNSSMFQNKLAIGKDVSNRKVQYITCGVKYFRCLYCTYYFANLDTCIKHIQMKHKDTSTSKVRRINFNGHCKFCDSFSSNWKSYNIHLQKLHEEKIHSTFKIIPEIVLPRIELVLASKAINRANEIVPHDSKSDIAINRANEIVPHDSKSDNEDFEMDISDTSSVHDYKNTIEVVEHMLIFKSLLFKCLKCDIIFLTSKSAIHHKDHMELLINWKCQICQNIFKKQDELAHRKQHSMCSKFTVIQLDATMLKKILYKCLRCGIHFYEDNYFSHSKTCKTVVAESSYCSKCDILIDKSVAGNHINSDHNLNKLKPEDFTVLVSDVIALDEKNDLVNNEIINRTEKEIEIPDMEIKEKRNVRFLKDYLKMCYCTYCRCFSTKITIKKKFHTELGLCALKKSQVCEDCGLVLNATSIRSHRALHKRKKGLKLQDFTFYDINNGKQILPPVPEYPKCNFCNVHVISKLVLLSHVCTENNFLTCHICDIKLSENVFKLHMAYHYYKNRHAKNIHSIVLDDIEKCTTNTSPLSSRPTSRQEIDAESNGSLNVRCDVLNINTDVNTKKQSNNDVNTNEQFNTKLDLPNKPIHKNMISKKSNRRQILQFDKSDFELYNVLYRCAVCPATIDTYDIVIEHCQDHLCRVLIETETCKRCGITVEEKYYNQHLKSHDDVKLDRKSLKLLIFDIFYFTLGNDIWVNHVFESLNKNEEELILQRSIYRESRIKMKVIQEGSPELTVFKCNSCYIIVDPDSLSKHAETACFKMRKYPCSSCGLPFTSYLSRQRHESIHMKSEVDLKSFKIVSFNDKDDKEDNKILTKNTKYFSLYQCRNCSAVMDIYKRWNHQCLKDLSRCKTCDLLIPNTDYAAHCKKHEMVPQFVQRNMKVTLFGQNELLLSDPTKNEEGLTCFDGTYVDYTFFRCLNCGLCVDRLHIHKHINCFKNNQMTQCSKCDLLVPRNKIIAHGKMHDSNIDFIKENMNIIPYSFNDLQAKFVPADNSKSVHATVDHVTDNNTKAVLAQEKDKKETMELSAKLYRCACGLHFLDEISVRSHFDHCNPKAAKQRCMKCKLDFSPKVLFDHLIKHHGDKSTNYKFNITNMTKSKHVIVTVYSCVNCGIHFVEEGRALAHFKMCHPENGILSEKEKCKKCHLFFDISSIEKHENEHHSDSIAEVDIVDINTFYSELGNQERKSSTTGVLQADSVIDAKKYKISEDVLSKIDLSKYDNTVFKCEKCNTYFLVENTFRRHFANGHNLSPQETCHMCGLNFSLQSLAKHIYIHHTELKLNSSDLVIKTTFSD